MEDNFAESMSSIIDFKSVDNIQLMTLVSPHGNSEWNTTSP